MPFLEKGEPYGSWAADGWFQYSDGLRCLLVDADFGLDKIHALSRYIHIPGFISQTGDCPSWTEAFSWFSSVLQQRAGMIPQIIQQLFPSTSFLTHYSLVILSFSATWALAGICPPALQFLKKYQNWGERKYTNINTNFLKCILLSWILYSD